MPGRVGMTVSEVAELHGIDIGPTAVAGVVERVNSDVWTEDLFGEGASLGYDHVKVPPAWAAKLPPRGAWELELLRNYWDDDDITSVSRLGSQLPLTKELDGIRSTSPTAFHRRECDLTAFAWYRLPSDLRDAGAGGPCWHAKLGAASSRRATS